MRAAVRWALVLLSSTGILLSGYLSYQHFGSPAICLGAECQTVMQSPYSKIFSLPLPAFGLLFYCTVLALSLWSFKANQNLRPRLQLAVFGLALTGFIFSLYLVYLQLAIIHSLCTFCLASAAITSSLLITSALNIPTARASSQC